jgi:ribonuclease E
MDQASDEPAGKAVTKGMALIAAYRAARISGRPQLRRELFCARAQMLRELGRGPPMTPPAPAAEASAAEPKLEPRAEANGSIFASLIDAALPPLTAAVAIPEIVLAAPTAEPEAATEAPTPPPAVEPPVLDKPVLDYPVPESPILESLVPERAPATAAPEIQQASPETLDPHEAPEPRAVIGLEVLGFGPGMLIRLNQLGIHTADDLATGEAATIRHALGDISRLINVDAWIARAKTACAA